jgi:endogenous inhibitor of DNA gyrase (YacG/DUF329 family)
MVDLGRWVNEEYRMPGESSPATDRRDSTTVSEGDGELETY